MKATGIVRKIDDLGRLSVPREFMRVLGMETGTQLEAVIKGSTIVYRKYNPGCVICGAEEDLKGIHDVEVCSNCIKVLKTK